jgi:hypothetical protein
VDQQVTNIDPGIPAATLRQLTLELFAVCGGVSLHSLQLFRCSVAAISPINLL